MARRKMTVKQLAETFDRRRTNAEAYLDLSFGSKHAKFDAAIYKSIKGDLKVAGITEKRSPFGEADLKNATMYGTFKGLRLHLWTRKELYNRLRWLRGEYTRLITNDGWTQVPDKPWDQLVRWRKEQIQTYMKALEDFAPMHKEIEQQKRNKYKREKRTTTKRTAYRAEVKKALNASRAKIGLAPKKEPVKLRSYFNPGVVAEREREREKHLKGRTLDKDSLGALFQRIAASPRRPISED